MKAIEDFRQATQKLIEAFCEKQKLDFEFFVADNPADIACFNSDFYININDIYHDLATNQPKGLIEWKKTII